MEIAEERTNTVRAMHYAITYLKFISEMIDERSTEFSSLELDEIKEHCEKLAKKIKQINLNRGYK